jgi:Domain of unknown function (DUF3883)
LVRLEDGTHVPAFVDGHAQAFLPGDTETGFPTVRASICRDEDTRDFLESLGLTEPDPVDDVIRILLPAYRRGEAKPKAYAADIGRILRAFETDSQAQKDKLIAALKTTAFVRTIDLGDGSSQLEVPEDAYVSAGRLRDLFSGIAGIRVIDDKQTCLRGEKVRALLEECGATRYIYPIQTTTHLEYYEKRKLRRDAGCEDASSDWPIQDHTLRGIDDLLDQPPTLDPAARAAKAGMLWEALIELEDRRIGAFNASYRWRYVNTRSVTFDSYFIRLLNGTPWIPDAEGNLQLPGIILFESLGWRHNPYLETKIQFKKPVVEELAKEAGIDLEVIHLLQKLGLTSIDELKSRLQVGEDEDDTSQPRPSSGSSRAAGGSETSDNDDEEDYADAEAGQRRSGDGVLGHVQPRPSARAGHSAAENSVSGDRVSHPGGHGGPTGQGAPPTGGSLIGTRAQLASTSREFVSYIGAGTEEDSDRDPDGLAPADRMALEASAIELILSREPKLEATPPGNKGFDLIERGKDGEPSRWIEVKAMKVTLQERAVGLSSEQFEQASTYGERYWLYVVENASDPARSRIVKVQDPAGRASTFLFDRGWVEIAEIDDLLDKAS